jgi:Ulp1 family protease
LLFSFVFQPGYGRGSPNFDRSLPPANILSFKVPSASHSPCRCAEYLSRISDLENRLSLLKRQAKNVVEQARKSFGLMKQVSSLESQMSDLMAKIVHLEECDSFLIEVIESACE